MPFAVVWSDLALRQLKKLDRPVAKRIFEKVEELREDSPRLVRKLVNSPYYRLRVGDYRIIVDIERAALRVLVLKGGSSRIHLRPVSGRLGAAVIGLRCSADCGESYSPERCDQPGHRDA